MSQHPTIEDLRRWRAGKMEGEQVLAIGAHLASCRECVTQAAERLGLDEAALSLCNDIESEERQWEDRSVGRPVRWWMLAIAASIAIVLVSLMAWPRRTAAPPVFNPTVSIHETPPPTPIAPRSGYEREEWNALVGRVRNGSPIEMPAVLRSMQSEADVLRGDAESSGTFSPAGIVVTAARPELSWPAGEGAQSIVQIFQDDDEVARSGVLTASHWTPERPLTRGRTYTWQVRVTQSGNTQILPASPTPVARFNVIDANTAAELESAGRAHPDDHLLLGILHARAGLDAEARAHLRRVTEPRDADAARRVLREIDSWRIAE